MRRRTLLKGIAGGAAGLGTIGVAAEGADEISDYLAGECEERTDTVTLGPGDAIEYEFDGDTYYLEQQNSGAKSAIRYGKRGSDLEEEWLLEETEVPGGEARGKDRFPVYVHIDLSDAWTGGDVIEPRGTAGVSLSGVEVTYDEEVCITEYGEASEMRPEQD